MFVVVIPKPVSPSDAGTRRPLDVFVAVIMPKVEEAIKSEVVVRAEAVVVPTVAALVPLGIVTIIGEHPNICGSIDGLAKPVTLYQT